MRAHRSPCCSQRRVSRSSYLVDVPSHRYQEVNGYLPATSDYSSIADLDALTLCVPTPLSKTQTPDISFVVAAAKAVAKRLQPEQLVVLQSTT